MTGPLATVSPLACRIRLAAEVERLRREAGLTQTALAAAVGRGRQAVIRVENPLTNLDRRPDADHVQEFLLTCGVGPDHPDYQPVLDLMWTARREGWWERGHPQMGQRQKIVADIELGASVICEYQAYLPPGLAQTAEFARHWAGGSSDGGATVDGIVHGRLQRQKAAFDRNDLDYRLVLEEMAIRRPTAPPEVLREQLHHLLDLAQRPNVSVRILPLQAPLGVGKVPTSPYSIYSYHHSPDPEIAVIDTALRDHVIIERSEVNEYAQLHEWLRDAALSDADSAALIRKVATSLTVGLAA